MKSPRPSHLFPLLTVLVLAGFAEASFFSARARADVAPVLGIRVEGGSQVRLAWRSSAAGFELEQSLSLHAPANWQTVTTSPALEGGEWVARLPVSDQTRFFRLRAVATALTTILETSPASGETGVAVTRETMVRLSAPLAAAATVGNDEFFAEFGGRKLLSRVQISSDRRTLTLFYMETLPGGARVRVVLQGDRLTDASGRALDADGDGVAGGTGQVEFQTFNSTPLRGTAIRGRVFASELVAGTDTGTNAVNRPLQGVTITVDGMEETLRTTTDAMGNFILTNSPGGRFFVHVDGRTAQGSLWPNGAYYPVVGKAWEAVAGRTDNLAGGTGEIYLPLIKAGTLQPVSATETTVIRFPVEVVAANPALEGVSISVPPNALFSDNGARGGRVGLAPVAPDRLPEPLPDGLMFPLVITVQTDGPLNFDEPASVRFPNLPDPVTGEILPAGAATALWSFNHDTGRWEIQGPMTVSADGRFVETDPGVGIRQPGWHGTNPGTPLNGPPGPPEPSRCEPAAAPAGQTALAAPPCGCEGDPADARKEHYKCMLDAALKAAKCAIGRTACQAACNVAPNFIAKWLCKKNCGDPEECKRQADALNERCQQLADCYGPGAALASVRRAAFPTDPVDAELAALASQLNGMLNTLSQQWSIQAQIFAIIGTATAQSELTTVQVNRIRDLDTAWRALLGGPSEIAYADAAVKRIDDAADRLANVFDVFPHGPVFYLIETQDGRFSRRGLSDPGGALRNVILRANTAYTVSRFDPVSGRVSSVEFVSARSGFPTHLPRGRVITGTLPDTDGDGLSDAAERVVGTNPNLADSDGDGLSDLVEITGGTNPLDGRAIITGIVASATVPGEARDIVTANDLALVALGNRGLGVFNIFTGLNPVLVSVVGTPGVTTAVAYDGTFAAAAGTAGLSIIDLSNPAAAVLARQINLGGTVIAVTAADGLAYAGVMGTTAAAPRRLVVVHMASGAVVQTLANVMVHDLVIAGQTLWCLTNNRLQAYRLDGSLVGQSPTLNFFAEGIIDRRRLFVGGAYAYATSYPGYDVVDIRNPAAMVLAGRAVDNGPNSFKQIVLDSGGYGVAAVGLVPRNDGTHDVYVYDAANPLVTSSLLTVLPTPGLTYAVALHKGLAYAADGTNGLQVLNYRPPDSGTNPPVITLTASFPLDPARVEENRPAWITAHVTDDVSVRAVEFHVNGERVLDDGAYPFEYRFRTPLRTPTRSEFTVRVKATDTAGNVTWLPEFTVELLPDATPPALLSSFPVSGTTLNDVVFELRALFDEPMAGSPLQDSFVVISPGPDGQPGTADDVVTQGIVRLDASEVLLLDLNATPLSNGQHRAVLRTSLRDTRGNSLATEVSWTFTVNDTTGPRLVLTTPTEGDANVPVTLAELTATLNEPARVSNVTTSGITLRGAGPDGTLGTLDDRSWLAQDVTLQESGRKLRFGFATPLVPDLYRATLSSNITDLAGNRVTGTLSWEFAVPLRTTLRGRVVFADGSPAPGVTVRRHEQGVPFGQTGPAGDFVFADLGFAPFVEPDINFHLVANGRAYLGRSLRVKLVPTGVTELGTIVLSEVCDPRLEDHLFGESGFLNWVNAFAQFDDGSGLALYAAGRQVGVSATNMFAEAHEALFRKDADGWRQVGGNFKGLFTPQIRALAVYDDGRGPALYVGGYFESVNGVAATNIARWNGRNWEALEGGLISEIVQPYGVQALLVFDDGSGPALYAGGQFDRAGNTSAANVARWNGLNWSAPGGGIPRSQTASRAEFVTTLAVFDDGTGPALYAGGSFDFKQSAGVSINATNIARWKNGQWSALAGGVTFNEFGDGHVKALRVFNDGGGNQLYVGGSFDRAGNVPVENLARWNGTAWSALPGEGAFIDEVAALGTWEDALGSHLLASGSFQPTPPEAEVFSLARWNGAQWSRLAGAADTVTDLRNARVFEGIHETNGKSLYIGGFSMVPVDSEGSLNARGAVKWDGQRWQPTEKAFDGEIQVIRAWDDGNGAALYVGGEFTTGGGRRVRSLARWDGNEIQPVGMGLLPTPFTFRALTAMVTYDDGRGSALYLCGNFTTLGPQTITNLARWNGREWSRVGGFGVDPRFNVSLRALAVFNDGTGPALFVGGAFTRFQDDTGIRTTRDLAKWNGTIWSPFSQLGNGQGTGLTGIGAMLAVESGPERGLYLGGIALFPGPGNQRIQQFAVWDGQTFRSPGDYLTVFPNVNGRPALQSGPEALAAIETVEGTEVYLSGIFYAADLREDPGLARMRNGRWERLPALPGGFQFARSIGFFDPVFGDLRGFDDGFGSQLYLAARMETPAVGSVLTRCSWAIWTGREWQLPGPLSGQPLTGNLLPFDLAGRPALLRSSTPFSSDGHGLVRWLRPAAPCP